MVMPHIVIGAAQRPVGGEEQEAFALVSLLSVCVVIAQRVSSRGSHRLRVPPLRRLIEQLMQTGLRLQDVLSRSPGLIQLPSLTSALDFG